MITYSEIKRYENLEFTDYLRIGGFSHSWLKNQVNGVSPDFVMNDNIRLGKLVDQIITSPHEVKMDNPLYPAARDIAKKINEVFGSLISQFEKQVSFSADMQFGEFKMKTTGRLDFLIPKEAVIDLKITSSKNIAALIAFMGYENQVWNYAKMANVKKSYLMIHSLPLKKTEIYPVNCNNDFNEFWADKIIQFGTIN